MVALPSGLFYVQEVQYVEGAGMRRNDHVQEVQYVMGAGMRRNDYVHRCMDAEDRGKQDASAEDVSRYFHPQNSAKNSPPLS